MESSLSNTWVESYLDALLNFGLSAEYQKQPQRAGDKAEAVNADRKLFAQYYVNQILELDEEGIRNAWSKATSTRAYGEKDVRLEYLSWRVWFLRRKKEAVKADLAGDIESTEFDSHPPSDEDESPTTPHSPPGSVATELPDASLNLTVVTRRTEELLPLPNGREPSRRSVSFRHRELVPTLPEDAVPPVDPLNIARVNSLYILLISMHGLVRGDEMELGRDPDTGGQVKYVVELARALSLLPGVHRVELLTRQIQDPKVDARYGAPLERIAPGDGEHGGAFIVRLPAGPTHKYLHKEALWPYVREFADRAIAHTRETLTTLKESGVPCELYAVHGHYADAGEAASLIAATLESDLLVTGHSLGRNKLEHLRASGTMTRAEMEGTYAISRRIEAEERSLDSAMVVFTSTRQEVEQQWGLYDGYDPREGGLATTLRVRPQAARVIPLMKVIPPGLDFSSLKVELPEDPVLRELCARKSAAAASGLPPSASNLALYNAALSPHSSAPATPTSATAVFDGAALNGLVLAAGNGSAGSAQGGSPTVADGGEDGGIGLLRARAGHTVPEDPPLWREVARFLQNPRKPVVLAMSRPDAKKNITTLVKAFGTNSMLRELANLVLIMGNRDNIDSMASGSANVLTQVLKLIDTYDLYGSVAYPKHHSQEEISDIYNLAYNTHGVFTNVALQEPFGLTVIEAAAHGVPTVATQNGGPVDIMLTLHHGLTVDPTDADAIGEKLLQILTNPDLWKQMSTAGRKNIMAYSWPSHCVKVLEVVETEKRRLALLKRHQYKRFSESLDAESIHMRITGLLAPTNSEPVAPPTAAGAAALLSAAGAALPPGDFEEKVCMPRISSSLDIDRAMSAPLDIHPLEERTGSGLLAQLSFTANDDSSLVDPSPSMSQAVMMSGGSGPRVGRRERLVVVQLDGSFATAGTARALEDAIDAARELGQVERIGFGVVSMLGFEDSMRFLNEADCNTADLDFIVCNNGADMWHNCDGDGWTADSAYEAHIDWRWERHTLSRTLDKWTSAPSMRNLGLKALMRNLPEEEKGCHPHHLTMELDSVARARLLSSMHSSKAGAPNRATLEKLAAYPPTYLLERLRRRLRRTGFRVNLTLQMVPRSSWLSVLHFTPLRASRPLALRWLAHRLGRSMDDVSMVLLPRKQTRGEGGEVALGSYTSDFGDLLAGWQRVWALQPSGRPFLGTPMRSMSAEYQESLPLDASAEEGGACSEELTPIERLVALVQPDDLDTRVTVTADVSRAVMAVAS